jgi:hypothetical protein
MHRKIAFRHYMCARGGMADDVVGRAGAGLAIMAGYF